MPSMRDPDAVFDVTIGLSVSGNAGIGGGASSSFDVSKGKTREEVTALDGSIGVEAELIAGPISGSIGGEIERDPVTGETILSGTTAEITLGPAGATVSVPAAELEKIGIHPELPVDLKMKTKLGAYIGGKGVAKGSMSIRRALGALGDFFSGKSGQNTPQSGSRGGNRGRNGGTSNSENGLEQVDYLY